MDSITASSKPKMAGWILLANILLSLALGCSIPSNGPQKTLTPEFVEQGVYPGRLIFVSSRDGASVFEFANTEKARINMKNGFLALSNHARVIPSRRSGGRSVKRLSILEEFLTENGDKMSIEKAIELVRTPYLSRDNFWDRLRVHNRQAYVFSPGTLNFWIARPPSNNNKPACYGSYVGFNLMQELYGSGQDPSPKSFPAHQ